MNETIEKLREALKPFAQIDNGYAFVNAKTLHADLERARQVYAETAREHNITDYVTTSKIA